MRAAALAIVIALAGMAAQRPEFEAASIRLNVDGPPYVFNGMKSLGVFSSENQTLKNLIQEAYGIPGGRRNWLPFFVAPGQGKPILGGPGWLGEDRYDITAKWTVPSGEPFAKAQADMELMLQSLLEKRCGLQLHRETRQLPIYEMTLTNTSKLKQADCVVFDPDKPGPSDAHYCGGSGLGRKGRDWTLDGNAMKMSQLADSLSWLIGGGSRTVIDKTGYKGTFDAHLRWTPDQGQVGATDSTPPPDDAGSIFSVLEQQLGLKLKTGTGPVEVLIIDHVERPSAN